MPRHFRDPDEGEYVAFTMVLSGVLSMKPMNDWIACRLMAMSMVALPGFAALPAFANGADAAAAGTRAEDAVRQASAAEVKAFLDKDPARLATLWSDDMVVTNPLNKFVHKLQVLGMVRSGVLTFSAYGRTIDYAHIYGDTVILAGHETVTWGSRMPHAGKTEQLLFTAVWMKQGGHWQEVARHANVVPPTRG
jgi:hypothetical protein